jgi:hypothetical protein
VKKKLVLTLFCLLFVRNNFFDPNLRGCSPEKFVLRKKWGNIGEYFGGNIEKIWENWENIAPW